MKKDAAACHALDIDAHDRAANPVGNSTLLQHRRCLVEAISLFGRQAHSKSGHVSRFSASDVDHQALLATGTAVVPDTSRA